MIQVLRYEFVAIEAEIVNKGVYEQVRIVQRSRCTNDPTRPDDLTEILKFGQAFMTNYDAEKFMKSKAFKTILKATQKNFSW